MKVTNSAHTPLRYPGGKSKITQFIFETMKKNGLNSTYVEPYAGGAGIAINLLLKDAVEDIVINDLDPSIYSFWYYIKHSSNELIEYINGVPFDYYDHADNLSNFDKLAYWMNIKNRFLKSRGTKTIEEAFTLFMLNRMNVSGVISGGMIGGKSQNGTYNISSRFNKSTLIKEISDIADKGDRIHVSNLDASQVVKKFGIGDYGDKASSLMFVDPPYFTQGRNLYNSYMTDFTHKIIAKKLLEEIDSNWILTYDLAQQISDLYPANRVNKYRYTINYSANKRGKYGEFMFASPKLQIASFGNVQLNEVI